MITLTYTFTCADEDTAHNVQKHIKMDPIVAIDGVVGFSAEWLAEAEEEEE